MHPIRTSSWAGLAAALFLTAAAAAQSRSDFNGDGYSDLAVGCPFDEEGGPANSGAVQVLYGGPDGFTGASQQLLFENAFTAFRETGDQFGTSLAPGDFNGDAYCDLAVGMPYEDLGALSDCGQVLVYYGGPAGLSATATQALHSASFLLEESALPHNAGAWFGFALVAGDFNGDGTDELAIGAPYTQDSWIFGGELHGDVYVFHGSAGGLYTGYRISLYDYYTNDIGPRAGWSLAAGDFFGGPEDDIAIGIPDVVGGSELGTVFCVQGGFSGFARNVDNGWYYEQWLYQVDAGSDAVIGDGFGYSLAAGDFGPSGKQFLAVGAPFEDVGSIVDAGAVSIFDVYAGTGVTWHQDSSGVLGMAEPYDRFGLSLAAGDFNSDTADDLAIGVPAEDVGTIADAGAVQVLYGNYVSGLGSAGNDLWYQDVTGVQGASHAYDQFGRAIAAARVDGDVYADLIIGAYNDNESGKTAGCLHVLFGGGGGLTADGDQLWHQDSANTVGTATVGDWYGWALGAR